MSVPTTKRSWQCAWAAPGMALTGTSGRPAASDSTSSVFHAITRSAGVSPGSPQSSSTSGSPGPPPTGMAARAARTDGRDGRRAQGGHQQPPSPSTRQATALASTVAGLRSRLPQLPE